MAQSAAQQQAEAQEDVARIARKLYEALESRLRDRGERATASHWESEAFADLRAIWETVARDLLRRDVIRVGARPNVERPMEGQTQLEDWQCDVCGRPLTQHAKACEGRTPPDER